MSLRWVVVLTGTPQLRRQHRSELLSSATQQTSSASVYIQQHLTLTLSLTLTQPHSVTITCMHGSAIRSVRRLEANAEVNEKSKNLHRHRSKTAVAIWMPFDIQPKIQCAKFHLDNFSRYGSSHA